jgi:broad specificity phosphatase PhoE
VPASIFGITEAVEAARDLRRRAMEAADNSRPRETARLLQRALRVLGGQLQDDPDWLEISSRLLISLASAEAEIKLPAAGLAHLDTAEELRVRLPEGEARSTVGLIIGSQRAIMLARLGRLADSVALFGVTVPRVDAEVDDNKLSLTTTLLNRSSSTS